MIDAEKIQQMIGLVGRETVANLLDTYTHTTDETLAHLRTAVSSKDVEQIRFHAHRLKGSSGTLGFLRVYALCKELEDHTKDSSLEGVYDALTRISQAYKDAVRDASALIDV